MPIVIILLIFSLIPYLLHGYWSDDLINSSLYGLLKRTDVSFYHYLVENLQAWIRSGRLFPVSALSTLPFYYGLRSVEYFRFYQVMLVLINAGLFYCFIKRWTRSQSFAAFNLLVLPLFFQMITYHDPICEFGGLLQWLVVFLLSGAICFFNYLEHKKNIQLFFSFFFLILSILTYEIGVVAFVVFLFLLWTESNDFLFRIKVTFYIAGLGLVYALVSTYCRARSPQVYAGILLGDPMLVVPTFFKQLSGSIPFSYFIFSPRSYTYVIDQEKFTLGKKLLTPSMIFSFFATIPLIYLALKNIFRNGSPFLVSGRKVFGLAAILFLLPAIPISLTFKYQREIGWGSAYLPVYMQYFGAALILSLILFRVVKKHPKCLYGLAGFLAFAFIFNFSRNFQLVRVMDITYRYPLAYFQKSLQLGLLKGVSPNTTLWLPNFGFSGLNIDFLYTYAELPPGVTLVFEKPQDKNFLEIKASYHLTQGTHFSFQGKEISLYSSSITEGQQVPQNWLERFYHNPYLPYRYQISDAP